MRRSAAAIQKTDPCFQSVLETRTDSPRFGRRTVLTLPLLPPPQKNRSAPSDSSPETPTPGGISNRSRISPVRGSIEFSFDPGDPGDEAVGFDGPKNRPGLGIDLMDFPVPILAYPERPFGPG